MAVILASYLRRRCRSHGSPAYEMAAAQRQAACSDARKGAGPAKAGALASAVGRKLSPQIPQLYLGDRINMLMQHCGRVPAPIERNARNPAVICPD
jgi:hypothetical protein